VAVPVALAAWFLDIPVVTHEQTITVGRANRFIQLLSKKVFVSWESSLTEVDRKKTIITGNPIRDETFIVKKTQLFQEYQQAMKRNPSSTKTIWVTGGNMGSHSINELVKSALPKLLKKYFIIHQTGRSDQYRDRLDLETFVKQLSPKLRHNYLVQEYIGPDDIGWVLKNSDVIVGRSGANTITDLLALTKPAILIPLPWAGRNEQYLNAKFYESLGGGVILEQKDATPEKLIDMLAEVCRDLDHYEKPLKEASKKLIADPAEKIVSEITKLLD
jgi:UDP-N-acetylglucosamine--N-acetylmuramyl-(pentapeptide) pyrophosphoryl-undecaprenol N-acetylglucosamine transferase